MQQRTRLTHSGFTSTEYRQRRSSRRRRKRRRAPSADSMLIKFGACALVCALALLVNAGRQRQITAATQEEPREYGRLTFVELPGILEVFAPSAPAAFKLEYTAEVYDEATLSLLLRASGTQAVPATVAGRVKAAGGGEVSLSLEGDRELCFAGLSEVSVEEGQRLGALDTVGTVAADAVLTIHARESGRPMDPRALLRPVGGAAV